MKSDSSAPNPLQATRYVRSVHTLAQLPVDTGIELAVAGRSNAGKSSALNAICAQNKLARTSRTPGRTQQLNYFEVAPERHLVDLPGYGYAKVPGDLRDHWRVLLDTYFQRRQALRGLVLVMDIRHPLKDFDRQMLAYATARGLPAHVLLTKADKLGRGEQTRTLQLVRKTLAQDAGMEASVQLFSAESRQGVDEARSVIAGWLGLDG